MIHTFSMRRSVEDIEIKEPPIEDITKKHSCAKSSCTSSCGCLFLVLLGMLILIKFVANPSLKQIATIPDSVPKNILIYDKDNISSISFVSGQTQGRSIAIASHIPSVILSPIFSLLHIQLPPQNKINLSNKKLTNLNAIRQLLHNTNHPDIVNISWNNLDAEPDFIFAYYKTKLQKNGYKIIKSSDTINQKIFSFSGPNHIDGQLLINDDWSIRGTDHMTLTLYIPTS